MTNESKLESEDVEGSQTSIPPVQDIKIEQAEITADHESAAVTGATNSRRPGLSKREMMEELSRQRFPWDE